VKCLEEMERDRQVEMPAQDGAQVEGAMEEGEWEASPLGQVESVFARAVVGK